MCGFSALMAANELLQSVPDCCPALVWGIKGSYLL